MANEEQVRLAEARSSEKPWRKWGPYLSERQWGTVREDYSAGGDAWNYLSHDAARARAYRWGEDGLAGISDDKQLLCLRSGPVEREGPDPQGAAVRADQQRGQPRRGRQGVLLLPRQHADPLVHEVPVQVPPGRLPLSGAARAEPQPVAQRLGVRAARHRHLRRRPLLRRLRGVRQGLAGGPAGRDHRPQPRSRAGAPARPAHPLVPQHLGPLEGPRPSLVRRAQRRGRAGHRGRSSGARPALPLRAARRPSCCSSTTRPTASGSPRRNGSSASITRTASTTTSSTDNRDAVNPQRTGTKAAAHYRLDRAGGRAGHGPPAAEQPAHRGAPGPPTRSARTSPAPWRPGGPRPTTSTTSVIPRALSPEQRHVIRQALAGMLWSKQFYDYDVTAWLTDRGTDPFGNGHGAGPRNGDWHHMVNGDVISMPDKWEYPWYAAWDLAFHALPLGLVDPDFAKQQLLLLLQERYLHPNGQVPAYEWNFGDVNPPVHAWAAYFLYQLDRRRTGEGDLVFLKTAFHKLLLNFTWWVNRKDPSGRNVFEGGFLGLDNIGVFDRSAPLPTGGHLEQADGTAWMAFYSQIMLQISIELALDDPDLRRHGAASSSSTSSGSRRRMTHIGGGCADVGRGGRLLLRRAAHARWRLHAGSRSGPWWACSRWRATTVFSGRAREKLPELFERARWFVEQRPQLVSNMHDPRRPGVPLTGACSPSSARTGCGGCWPTCSTRTSSSAPTASARCRPATATSPTVSGRGDSPTAWATCRPSRTAACSAATRTGGARSGCRSTPCSSGRCCNYYAYYGDSFSSRVPHRIGAHDEPVPGRPRADPAAGRASSPPTRRGTGRSTAAPRSSATIPTGATTSCFTSTSTATTAPASAPATRPAGPGWWRRCSATSPP